MMRGMRRSMAAATLLAGLAGAAWGQQVQDTGLQLEFDAAQPKRGWITLGLQSVRTHGSFGPDGESLAFLDDLVTDSQALLLGVDYRLSPRWSVHASLPMIRKRARNDPGAHNPALLNPPVPDAPFLDDGRYHSSWQDWRLGLAFHDAHAGFDLRYHALLIVPSRSYPFYGSAAVGQRLERLRLGFDASRRIGRSNFIASGGYSYEFVRSLEGRDLDQHHLRLSGRYHFSPAFSADVFLTGRVSHTGEDADFSPFLPLWYQHDRLLRQNYAFVGLGGHWSLSRDWALSVANSRMVHGESLHDVDYVWDVAIRRAF